MMITVIAILMIEIRMVMFLVTKALLTTIIMLFSAMMVTMIFIMEMIIMKIIRMMIIIKMLTNLTLIVIIMIIMIYNNRINNDKIMAIIMKTVQTHTSTQNSPRIIRNPRPKTIKFGYSLAYKNNLHRLDSPREIVAANRDLVDCRIPLVCPENPFGGLRRHLFVQDGCYEAFGRERKLTTIGKLMQHVA